jgi:DNA transformation protein
MFGGQGIWHQGIMVGAVVDGVVHLRGDAVSGPEFEAAGGERWTYSAKMKKAVNMPYWTIPDSAIDDPDELAVWTRKAYEAALRAKAVSNAPKKVKTSGSRAGYGPIHAERRAMLVERIRYQEPARRQYFIESSGSQHLRKPNVVQALVASFVSQFSGLARVNLLPCSREMAVKRSA